MDLKDASVQPSDIDEKRMHMVEVLHFVDVGPPLPTGCATRIIAEQ
uniref:Uncharacterized protein n=1 Tax=Thermosporothrix sp. COM3 TaxID=2490863 RepID=A0A455STK2_9CHLR|nr:hypothetical protein KTC_64580 [Thermosporothrix sp. COM3]